MMVLSPLTTDTDTRAQNARQKSNY